MPTSQQKPPKSRKIWKLLFALLLTGGVLVGAPYALSRFQLIGPLQGQAWLILIVTMFGLLLKTVFGDLVAGEFNYYKHGYDFCIITLGASLSSFAMQLVSKHDLFPNLPKTGPINVLASVAPDVIDQRRILLLLIFAASCFLALLTAYIGRHIKEGQTAGAALLSGLNFILGSALLSIYVLILITKD